MDDMQQIKHDLNGLGKKVEGLKLDQKLSEKDICNMGEDIKKLDTSFTEFKQETRAGFKEVNVKIDQTTSKQTWLLGVAFGAMQVVSLGILIILKVLK